MYVQWGMEVRQVKRQMNIQQFWADVLAQRADEIRTYFHDYAHVNWYCSNECFTVEEFRRANCEYPDEWDGEIEKNVTTGDMIITATQMYSKIALPLSASYPLSN